MIAHLVSEIEDNSPFWSIKWLKSSNFEISAKLEDTDDLNSPWVEDEKN